jgi:hypothetical protein
MILQAAAAGIDPVKSLHYSVVVTALIVSAPAWSQAGEDAVDTEQTFDLPAADFADTHGDGGFELSDANYAGNPLKSLVEKWPEDLVLAPVPGYSPQIGWNLTLAGGYFLGPRDTAEGPPPSVLGGFGMIAENGSYAYGGGGKLHLLDDRLRIKAAAGYMDIRYRFYGVGNEDGDRGISTDILQDGPLYFVSGLWRVWNRLYAGLGYLHASVDTRVRFGLPDPNFFDPTLSMDIAAYEIPLEFDSRDHEQFPRKGWLVSGRAFLYRDSAGSDIDAETFKIAVNHYRPMRERDVLASRAYVRTTSGEAPFFLMSTFGGSTDLRGYPSGRYRDRMMYALQSEYRWHFSDRWIFTGFAGVGEVADQFKDFGRNFLPAAGVGVRFVLSEKHRVSLSTDIAVGKDGMEFYFGVGEAF